MEVKCPYCGCDALVRLEAIGPNAYRNPDEVYFRDVSGHRELNDVNWQAYTCAVCKRTVILDEDAVGDAIEDDE